MISPGGARRPAEAPQRAAWSVLEASLAQGADPVVAACDACGQPMTGPAGLAPRIAWHLELPQGSVDVSETGTISGPQGALSPAQARAQVVEQTAPPPWWRQLRLGRGLFQTVLLVAILGPLSLWALGVAILAGFFGPMTAALLEAALGLVR